MLQCALQCIYLVGVPNHGKRVLARDTTRPRDLNYFEKLLVTDPIQGFVRVERAVYVEDTVSCDCVSEVCVYASLCQPYVDFLFIQLFLGRRRSGL